MMRKIILTDEAIDDIVVITEWYSKKQESLGVTFFKYLFDCFEEINHQPFAYPSKYRFTREMAIKKYPYLIIYSIEGNAIFILRVFPSKQDPGKKYK